MDITLYGAAHVDRCGRCFSAPEFGKSNPGKFANFTGGAAWNVASNLATLGCDVLLHSIIGDDEDGKILIQSALARNFHFNPQISPDKSTANYTSILAPNGDLSIALADMEIYRQFNPARLESASDSRWVLVDTNLPEKAILEIAGKADNNLAAMTVSSAKAIKLKSSLPMIDVLCTNRAELAALCSTDENGDMEEALLKFRDLGGQKAIVSNGADGIWSIDSNAMIERHAVPIVSSIKDVTGAGDALTAGAIFELMALSPMAHAIQTGIKLSQAILEVEGAWRSDLNERI